MYQVKGTAVTSDVVVRWRRKRSMWSVIWTVDFASVSALFSPLGGTGWLDWAGGGVPLLPRGRPELFRVGYFISPGQLGSDNMPVRLGSG